MKSKPPSGTKKIRLEDFEREILLRPPVIEDFDALVAMQALWRQKNRTSRDWTRE